MAMRILLLFCFLAQLGFAQNLDLERRYTFAKTYFGTELMFFSQLDPSSYLDAQSQLQPLERSPFLSPTFTIGGTHFWGHADFFVALATRPIALGRDLVGHSNRFRAITGMRLYPFPLQNYKLRPFGGFKFAPIRLNQENLAGENYRRTQVKSIWELGLGYATPQGYFYLGYNFVASPDAEVYLSREIRANSSFPQHFLSLAVNYRFETTAGSFPPAVQALDSTLRRKNRLGWFLGIGPSSAFPLRTSSYVQEKYPFLDDRAMPDIFPELTVGYHFSKQELAISAAFRPIRQERSAFGLEQTVRRNSITLEVYKFLFDYHGFAPFIGVGLMHDRIRLRETDQGQELTDAPYTQTTPSLVFGWDIRPARRADDWLLRTNLRYNPNGKIAKDGATISLEHLEFNFIQLVIYPQRLRAYRKF